MASIASLPGPARETPELVERELMRVERELHVLLGVMHNKRTKTLGENLGERYGRIRRSIEDILKKHFQNDGTAKRALDHLGYLWGRSKLKDAIQNLEIACQMLGELRIHFTNQRLKDLQQKVQQLQFTLDTASKHQGNGGETPATAQPSDLAKPSSIFVIMPFAEAFADVWAGAIQRATRAAGFEPIRVDMINRSSDITDDIIDAISNCHAAIVDVTGANANVMFELGYALAKEKPQVIISQSTDFLPFDIRNLRTVVYQDSWAGIEKLHARLIEFLRELPRPDRRSMRRRRKSRKASARAIPPGIT